MLLVNMKKNDYGVIYNSLDPELRALAQTSQEETKEAFNSRWIPKGSYHQGGLVQQ